VVGAGERRRIDTAVMRAFPKRVVSKGGAEGVLAMGFPPGALPANAPFGDGPMGVAAKVEDGSLGPRAGDAISVAILRQLGMASDPLAGPLVDYAAQPILDPRGDRAGDVRAAFRIG
jgi:L-asparaginase II